MKTLSNLFSKSKCINTIDEFNNFSLNINHMKSIKGGTNPVITNGVTNDSSYLNDKI